MVELAGKIASTTHLDWEKWIVCIVIGFISFPLAAIVKLIPVSETPFLDYFRIKKYRRKDFLDCFRIKNNRRRDLSAADGLNNDRKAEGIGEENRQTEMV